ncbi:hypothetical protein Metig_1123 [Methanotorris igneus Kol 5]|uniref:Uncharacterized protein n=1 Tax=Methanotorris igneus (strain DSM 5666 / JCM 11834 / Kol 5) TaxID=880724 RepID=F6BDV1_METIK|nr:hypothetical protein Metig_1123 [Methanotorris igneus Kol 5]
MVSDRFFKIMWYLLAFCIIYLVIYGIIGIISNNIIDDDSIYNFVGIFQVFLIIFGYLSVGLCIGGLILVVIRTIWNGVLREYLKDKTSIIQLLLLDYLTTTWFIYIFILCLIVYSKLRNLGISMLVFSVGIWLYLYCWYVFMNYLDKKELRLFVPQIVGLLSTSIIIYKSENYVISVLILLLTSLFWYFWRKI